jgi:hypothetical protein
MKTDSAKP